MDFVVGFSTTTMGGYDTIWVVVDRLTKSSHFILVRVKYTIEKLAEQYNCATTWGLRFIIYFPFLKSITTWLGYSTIYKYNISPSNSWQVRVDDSNVGGHA